MVEAGSRTSRRRLLWLVLAAVLHLVVLPFYVSSGLVAPAWAVVSLLLLWVLLAAALVHLGRRRGAPALLVPPVALALWFLLVTAGEQLLGWTA